MASLTIHELPEDERPREKLDRARRSCVERQRTHCDSFAHRHEGRERHRYRPRTPHKVRLARRARAVQRSPNSRRSKASVRPRPCNSPRPSVSRAASRARRSPASGMDTPDLISELLGSEMRALTKESLRVVLLDTKLHLICVEQISLGSLNESIAHPREIFRPALIYAAYAVIVVHNHPSGDPTPSEADHTSRVASPRQPICSRSACSITSSSAPPTTIAARGSASAKPGLI